MTVNPRGSPPKFHDDPDSLAAASESTIETLSQQAVLVDSPDLSSATPANQLPLGIPAPYWLDLLDYRPAEIAAMLGKPMLILQGGRDYQVTVAEDLAGWQDGLADHADVTINVYPPLNHIFCAGTGPPNPPNTSQPNTSTQQSLPTSPAG